MAISITTPLTREKVRTLKSGDSCLISGVIYTARDAAHKRLCELVEQGKAVGPEAEALLRPLLEPLKGKLQALVLGCTHYPFAARSIRAILGDSVALLDGGEGTARETRRRLEQAGLLWDGPGEIRFESSLPGDGILSLSRSLLEQK